MIKVRLEGRLTNTLRGFMLVSPDLRILPVRLMKNTTFIGEKYPKDGLPDRCYETHVSGYLRFNKKDLPYLLAINVE